MTSLDQYLTFGPDLEFRRFCSRSPRSLACAIEHACRGARSSVCGVQVARYCQEGFKASLDTNCYDACVNGGRLQSFLTERRLDEVCQHALKEVPRPLCHDACVRGYRAGVEDMSTTLVKRIAEVRTDVMNVCVHFRHKQIGRGAAFHAFRSVLQL